MTLGSLPATFRAVTMVMRDVPYTPVLLFARLHAMPILDQPLLITRLLPMEMTPSAAIGYVTSEGRRKTRVRAGGAPEKPSRAQNPVPNVSNIPNRWLGFHD